MPLFIDFLTSGRLGAVQLGVLPERVSTLLGPADDESLRQKPVYVMRYGAVDFTFAQVPDTTDFRLAGTAIRFASQRPLPEVLRPSDWFPTDQTTEAEFRAYLAQANLPVEYSVDGEQATLILGTGATITFMDDLLYSVHFNRRDKRADNNLSLSDETFQLLRAQALREHISVSEVVERALKRSAAG